jgi:hypothetical protein
MYRKHSRCQINQDPTDPTDLTDLRYLVRWFSTVGYFTDAHPSAGTGNQNRRKSCKKIFDFPCFPPRNLLRLRRFQQYVVKQQ